MPRSPLLCSCVCGVEQVPSFSDCTVTSVHLLERKHGSVWMTTNGGGCQKLLLETHFKVNKRPFWTWPFDIFKRCTISSWTFVLYLKSIYSRRVSYAKGEWELWIFILLNEFLPRQTRNLMCKFNAFQPETHHPTHYFTASRWDILPFSAGTVWKKHDVIVYLTCLPSFQTLSFLTDVGCETVVVCLSRLHLYGREEMLSVEAWMHEQSLSLHWSCQGSSHRRCWSNLSLRHYR